MAIEVADDLQGVGVGTALARHLRRRAHENDVVLLTATTLRDNRAARQLAKRLGYRRCAGRGSEIDWELSLVAPS